MYFIFILLCKMNESGKFNSLFLLIVVYMYLCYRIDCKICNGPFGRGVDSFKMLFYFLLALATQRFFGGGQIDEHCWSNMTSQLTMQCCRGWPNCPTCGVQKCVIMCVEQC